MHESVQKLNFIKNKIKEIIERKQLKTNPQIIAITKTFQKDKILPLLESGHLHYGENKIQEAEDKWNELKKNYSNLSLHMVGKLQSNKAKKAVKLFEFIHSLDNAKLATKLSQYEKELNKKTKIFIQVNIAEENQKSGILLNDLKKFYDFCVNEQSLNIIGLMTLPPIDKDSFNYFRILKEKSIELNLYHLSIGMSSDFLDALEFNPQYIRLGTALFGKRL